MDSSGEPEEFRVQGAIDSSGRALKEIDDYLKRSERGLKVRFSALFRLS